MLISKPVKKIAYSCFVDSKGKFERETVRWVWSLHKKLGVSGSDIFITCDQGVSQEFLGVLKSIEGINIHFEDRFTTVSPPANKWLQMKNLSGLDSGYTHVVVSDCDKVFLSFSDLWCDDSIRACKFIPRPTYSVFKEIFAKYFNEEPRFIFEKPDPQDPLNDTRQYVNNHNGGLILIPTSKITEITSLWKHWIDELLSNTDILKANVRNLDQVAFALSMHSIGSDINFIPKTLDLGPNIRSVSPHVLRENSGQLILHIHGSDDDDGNIICGDDVPAEFKQLIDETNSAYQLWKNDLTVQKVA